MTLVISSPLWIHEAPLIHLNGAISTQCAAQAVTCMVDCMYRLQPTECPSAGLPLPNMQERLQWPWDSGKTRDPLWFSAIIKTWRTQWKRSCSLCRYKVIIRWWKSNKYYIPFLKIPISPAHWTILTGILCCDSCCSNCFFQNRLFPCFICKQKKQLTLVFDISAIQRTMMLYPDLWPSQVNRTNTPHEIYSNFVGGQDWGQRSILTVVTLLSTAGDRTLKTQQPLCLPLLFSCVRETVRCFQTH